MHPRQALPPHVCEFHNPFPRRDVGYLLARPPPFLFAQSFRQLQVNIGAVSRSDGEMYRRSQPLQFALRAHRTHQVGSLGQEYSAYADRIVADSVSGATVEFIFEQNYKAGETNGVASHLVTFKA